MEVKIISIFLILCKIVSLRGQQCPAGLKPLESGIACVSDFGCNMQATGYKCYNGICCTNSGDSGVGYGWPCTTSIQCQYLNSQCINNICGCAHGFTFDGRICSASIGPNGVPFNGYCTASVQCQTPNSICLNNICTCPIGYSYSNGRCKSPGTNSDVPFRGYCTTSSQCKTTNSVCMNNMCDCPIGTTYRNDICTRSMNPTTTCSVPGSQVEMRNGQVVNCLMVDCSPGYYCELSASFNNGQYICCGFPPGVYGEVKMYPNTNTPLECSTPSSCNVFHDTPYCVFSSRFSQRVCCSTLTC